MVQVTTWITMNISPQAVDLALARAFSLTMIHGALARQAAMLTLKLLPALLKNFSGNAIYDTSPCKRSCVAWNIYVGVLVSAMFVPERPRHTPQQTCARTAADPTDTLWFCVYSFLGSAWRMHSNNVRSCSFKTARITSSCGASDYMVGVGCSSPVVQHIRIFELIVFPKRSGLFPSIASMSFQATSDNFQRKSPDNPSVRYLPRTKQQTCSRLRVNT